jgi:hypothetical protein
VFQSYSAYTPALQEMNAACYEAPDGPDCVLFALQPLDGYFPTVADSQALLALFAGYDPQFVERDFVLMQRKRSPAGGPTCRMQVVSEGTAAIGTWVEVEATPGAVHFAQPRRRLLGAGSPAGLALRAAAAVPRGAARGRHAAALPHRPGDRTRAVPARSTRARDARVPRVVPRRTAARVQAFRVRNSGGGSRGFADRFGVRLLSVATR